MLLLDYFDYYFKSFSEALNSKIWKKKTFTPPKLLICLKQIHKKPDLFKYNKYFEFNYFFIEFILAFVCSLHQPKNTEGRGRCILIVYTCHPKYKINKQYKRNDHKK